MPLHHKAATRTRNSNSEFEVEKNAVEAGRQRDLFGTFLKTMLRAIVPRNARSKRALEARAPKEIENERTAIFVRGSHTGEVLNGAMKDLMVLKRPHAISFSKKNEIHPFEPTGVQSLEFWSTKNDAAFFVVGTNTKKRPNNLTLVRMYDNKVLDMVEVGIRDLKLMQDFKVRRSLLSLPPTRGWAGVSI